MYVYHMGLCVRTRLHVYNSMCIHASSHNSRHVDACRHVWTFMTRLNVNMFVCSPGCRVLTASCLCVSLCSWWCQSLDYGLLCACTCNCTWNSTHIYLCVNVLVYVYIPTHTRVYVHMELHMYIRVLHIYICRCKRVYTWVSHVLVDVYVTCMTCMEVYLVFIHVRVKLYICAYVDECAYGW